MKLTVAGLIVVLVGWLSPSEPSAQSPARTLRADASPVAAVAVAAPVPARADSPAVVLNRPYKKVRLPVGCNNKAKYDVVIHFHGVPKRVISSFEKAGLDAVLVVMNLGAGSGRYEDSFAHEGSLANLLSGVHKLVQKHCGELTQERVALSSWSAGYGASYRILSHPADAALVDAVLLADGLHAGYEPLDRRKVSSAQMEPFSKFAARAARDEAVMVITHSSIAPPKYASTTQTAAHLISHVGAATSTDEAPAPRDMRQVSSASAGGFSVRGFAGNNAAAHCDHLYALDALLFTPLNRAWR